jgi:hypothetical protein
MDTVGCQLLIALVMQASSNPVSFVMETEEIGRTGIFISLPDILFLFDPIRTPKSISIVKYGSISSS